MSEKFEGVERLKDLELNPETLRKLEIRHDPTDYLFDVAAGISFQEKLEDLYTTPGVKMTLDQKGFFDRLLEGPVVYLNMPDAYDLTRFGKNFEEWRRIRMHLRKSDPVIHDMLEKQRVKMASVAALHRPLLWAQSKGIGDQSVLSGLLQRFDAIQQTLVPKVGEEELDHRIMSLDEKSALLQDTSVLARDILFFGIQTLETQM